MTDAAAPVFLPATPAASAVRERWAWYAMAVGFVAAAHVLSAVCWQSLGPATHSIFLAAVVLASLYGGYGPGVVATVLAGGDLAFSFMPPYYSFQLGLDEGIVVASFVAVAVLISGLQARRRSAEASLRREREGLERRVAERTAELLASQDKLKLLVSDLVTVAEREQQRIGRDLHDGLGQELTGISLLGSALAGRLSAEGSAACDDAEQVAELVRNSIRHTRDLARGLCPVDLEDEGLASALGRLAERVSRLPGVRCTLTVDPAFAAGPELDATASIHLYRVAQEAINNALRHGHARTIDLNLAGPADAWSLTIADDGRGFRPADVPAGMGRRLMQHRASAVGARLDVRSGPAGVRVTCQKDPT